VKRPAITRAHPYTPKSGPFAAQTFTSRRQYGNVHARLKGYASLAARQRATGQAPTKLNLGRLSALQEERYEGALKTLRYMRQEGLSLKQAAAKADTTPTTVRRYVGRELEKRGGRYFASGDDRLPRTLKFNATHPGEPVVVTVRNSKTASLIARHDVALRRYVYGDGDAGPLLKFAGKYIQVEKRRYWFLTDLNEINLRARRGQLSFESIYAAAA
jgi:hypothetical protein